MHQSPTVTHFIGELGFKSVCQRSIDYAQNEILFLTDILEWYKVYTAEYDNKFYIPKRLEKNIALKMLTPKSPRAERMKERDIKLNRETRFLASDFKTESTVIIYGNEVAIVVSQEPYLAIVIKDRAVHDTLKNIFYTLWNKTDE